MIVVMLLFVVGFVFGFYQLLVGILNSTRISMLCI